MANIFAFVETRDGAVRKIGLEAVTAARALADQAGGEVHAMIAGAPGIESVAERIGAHGADVVLVAARAGLERYSPETLASAIADRVRAGGYRAMVFPTSALGADLAPRVAARLGAGYVADVTSAKIEGDAIVVTHPVNIGKVVATVRMTGSPVVIGVRANVFTPVENAKAGRMETMDIADDPSAARVVVTDVKTGGGGKLDLGEAPVIVSGGRGLKAPENFSLVEDLAAAFGNAAVGATRAVTDDGWRPHSDQIGQTGRTVSPQLYVAVGISGAIQHVAGMRTAKTIVAINKDKEAPIFKVADYGIVGDVMEVVPALTAAVKEAKARG